MELGRNEEMLFRILHKVLNRENITNPREADDN
jgi:hypothetical protein